MSKVDKINRRVAIAGEDYVKFSSCFEKEQIGGHNKNDNNKINNHYVPEAPETADGNVNDTESVKTELTVGSTIRDSSTIQRIRSSISTAPSSPTSAATTGGLGNTRDLKRSVLIVGITGRTGIECIRQFANSQSPPGLYGFCRDMQQISEGNMRLCNKSCEQLIVGDATNALDLYRALQISKADTVIVCIGDDSGGNRSKEGQQVRRLCAEALVKVLVHPPFHHVRIVAISSDELRTGGGRALLGCWGSRMRHSAFNVKDHQGQEDVFNGNVMIRERTTLVRATRLTRDSNTHRLATFAENESKPPGFKTDRKHLARWLVTESIYHIYSGRTVHVTSA